MRVELGGLACQIGLSDEARPSLHRGTVVDQITLYTQDSVQRRQAVHSALRLHRTFHVETNYQQITHSGGSGSAAFTNATFSD